MKKQRSKGYARRKGHQFERDIAIELRAVWEKARRHLEYQDAVCFGVDIAETENWKFQCKKLKGYASVNTIREVKCDRAAGEIPVLVTAGDNLEAMAVLPFSELLKLLQIQKCAELF